MLQGEHITVRYGSFTVVEDLSFDLKEGQWLKKGDDMGSFLFGGSDVIMVFQKGVNVELLTTPDGEGGYEHILMGEPYAKLVVNK